MNLNKSYYQVSKYIKNNSANILTGLGMVGVATTAVLGIKATPKAIRVLDEKEEYKMEKYNEPLTKMEKALVLTPVYLPTILMGATTMSCIYGANYFNKKHQAVLSGAYTYLHSCYSEYKQKVKDLYGEEADYQIRDEIARDRYMAQKESEEEEQENEQLYYDEYSGRYFNMNPDDLPNMLYEMNRMYNFTGEFSLNNVYEYLGLEPTDFGDTVGWNALKDWECRGFSWIDITTEPMTFPDNLGCLAIQFNVEPNHDYITWSDR
jgi:hypothetical protein